MKGPTGTLEEEHHYIRMVVGTMAVFAERLQAGQDVPVEMLQQIIDFMRIFGDKCHHGKEEWLLFPLLEQKGVPIRGCPLGVLIQEHERGRTLVAELAQAADAYASTRSEDTRAQVQKSLHSLTELYPGHIWREEYLLLPMTEKIVGAEELRALHGQFQLVEEEIGSSVHARYEQLAERLQGEVQRLS